MAIVNTENDKYAGLTLFDFPSDTNAGPNNEGDPKTEQEKKGPPPTSPSFSNKRSKGKEIGDFGRKIGGARKDFYNNPLAPEELRKMSGAELGKVVTRGNIWPPINLEEMRDEGFDPEVAAYAVAIRNAIPGRPKVEGRDLRPEEAEAYLSLVSDIREAVGRFTPEMRLDDAATLVRSALEGKYYQKKEQRGRGGGTFSYTDLGKRLHLIGVFNYRSNLFNRAFNATSRKSSISKSYLGVKWSQLIKERTAGGEAEHQGKSFNIRQAVNKATYLDHVRRYGPDWRSGRNVTPEEIMEVFGLSGGEFGNWVRQTENSPERQVTLNATYDSLKDLSEALGIPTRAIGLGGRIAIGWGSRGRPGAAAHYEPATAAIALTKTAGHGSLAHEFGHALDNWAGASVAHSFFGEIKNHGPLITSSNFASLGGYAQLGTFMVEHSTGSLSRETALRLLFDDRHQRILEMYVGFMASAKGLMREGIADDLLGDVKSAINTYESHMENIHDRVMMDTVVPMGYEKIVQYVSSNLRGLHVQIGEAMKEFDRRMATIEELKRKAGRSSRGFYKSRLERLESRYPTTDYMKAALTLDGYRSKPYFSTAPELFARAFEIAVKDRLAEMDIRNDYLVSPLKGDKEMLDALRALSGGEMEIPDPYPQGEIRKAFLRTLENNMAVAKESGILLPQEDQKIIGEMRMEEARKYSPEKAAQKIIEKEKSSFGNPLEQAKRAAEKAKAKLKAQTRKSGLIEP